MRRSTSMDRSALWLTFPPRYTNSFVWLCTWPAASTLNVAVNSDIPFARKHIISVLASDTMRPNAYRRTFERRVAASVKAKIRIIQNFKQNKRNTRERRHNTCKPNARRIRVRATCDSSTMTIEPAQARLLWDILSLVLPVTFGYTGLLYAVVQSWLSLRRSIWSFATKRSVPRFRHSAPFSLVLLGCSRLHWSALMPKVSLANRPGLNHYFLSQTYTSQSGHK